MLTAAFLLLAGGFAACDLGGFPKESPLHPPGGLTLISTNANIQVGFWAFNDEEPFGGYNIYMDMDKAVVCTRPDTSCVTNSVGRLPTIARTGDSHMRWVTHTVTRAPGGAALNGGDTWYVTVASYDKYSLSITSHLAEVLLVEVGNAPFPGSRSEPEP